MRDIFNNFGMIIEEIHKEEDEVKKALRTKQIQLNPKNKVDVKRRNTELGFDIYTEDFDNKKDCPMDLVVTQGMAHKLGIAQDKDGGKKALAYVDFKDDPWTPVKSAWSKKRELRETVTETMRDGGLADSDKMKEEFAIKQSAEWEKLGQSMAEWTYAALRYFHTV